MELEWFWVADTVSTPPSNAVNNNLLKFGVSLHIHSSTGRLGGSRCSSLKQLQASNKPLQWLQPSSYMHQPKTPPWWVSTRSRPSPHLGLHTEVRLQYRKCCSMVCRSFCARSGSPLAAPRSWPGALGALGRPTPMAFFGKIRGIGSRRTSKTLHISFQSKEFV